MTPTDVIPVNMNAQDWNTVMSLLAEAPFKLSAPLIQHIQMQCMEFDRQHQPPTPDNVRPMRVAGGEQGAPTELPAAGE